LQLIGEPPDDQIATEAQGQSGVMQCPPDAPQLRCRPIDQPGDFAIKPRKLQAQRQPLPEGLRLGAGEREDYTYSRTR
jgi:hypothetical protein